MTNSEALAAADWARTASKLVARPGGWLQGTLHDNGSGVVTAACALGACYGRGLQQTRAQFLVECELRERVTGSPHGIGVAQWNNHPDRQQHEVVELFESIAKHFDRLASRVEG